jgi:hypothetical protein
MDSENMKNAGYSLAISVLYKSGPLFSADVETFILSNNENPVLFVAS